MNTISGYHANERAALLRFKSLLRDPSNRLATWQGQNCCKWHGIHCSDSAQVISVNLQNPNPVSFILNSNSKLVSTSNSTYTTALESTISLSLFTLSHIQYLDLSFNNFMYSKIPTGLSNLTKLTYLNLSNAMFQDSITTHFANLTSLTQLDFSCSRLISDVSSVSYNLTSSRVSAGSMLAYINRGKISSSSLSWLLGLHKLTDLRLTGVDLLKASQSNGWAKPLAMLSNLRFIHLSNCKIVGRLPIHELLNLTYLSSLRMDYNFLASPIPNQLANISSLSILDLRNSHVQCNVPYLPQLRALYMSNNSGITINLRSMLALPWNYLEIIDIGSTNVNGSIPTSLANMSSLISFFADSCSLHGSIPSSLYDLPKLEILFLNFNHIPGRLSPSISNLQNLRRLSLTEKSLEGPIPDSIYKISSLQYLNLAGNKMTGELPDCFRHLTNISTLALSLNNMNGTIPSLMSLFKNSSPSMIVLGSSEITVIVGEDPFPPNFQPRVLELRSSNVGGGIPEFLYNLTQVEYLVWQIIA